VGHENSAAFLAAVAEQSKRQVVLDDVRICETGRQFGIRYICAAAITPAFGAPGTFTVFARMLNTETEKARLNGEATGPLKTAEDVAAAAGTVVEKMLGKRSAASQSRPEPTVIAAPAAPTPFKAQEEPGAVVPENRENAANSAPAAAAKQGKQTVAVYMSGEEPKGAKGARGIISGELVKAMNESGKYTAIDRTEAIIEQLDRSEPASVEDDGRIKTIGRLLGVEYLCISDIDIAGKRYSLDTRLVDVVTAEVTRSAKASSTLRDAAEMARVGRNIAHELLGANKAREDTRTWKKTMLRGAAISLDALGALAFAYGYNENRNVVKHTERINENHIKNGPEADKAASKRNVAYMASGALLASGIAIHVFF
jgi:curli biogenesis system outer membrane secretion channel CsgG